jgi:hypothetical protein
MSLPLTFGGVTHVMAVINLSPESRNPPSVVGGAEEARSLAHEYAELGAGGEGSAPAGSGTFSR